MHVCLFAADVNNPEFSIDTSQIQQIPGGHGDCQLNAVEQVVYVG